MFVGFLMVFSGVFLGILKVFLGFEWFFLRYVQFVVFFF